jgi:hypothetical protein
MSFLKNRQEFEQVEVSIRANREWSYTTKEELIRAPYDPSWHGSQVKMNI